MCLAVSLNEIPLITDKYTVSQMNPITQTVETTIYKNKYKAFQIECLETCAKNGGSVEFGFTPENYQTFIEN